MLLVAEGDDEPEEQFIGIGTQAAAADEKTSSTCQKRYPQASEVAGTIGPLAIEAAEARAAQAHERATPLREPLLSVHGVPPFPYSEPVRRMAVLVWQACRLPLLWQPWRLPRRQVDYREGGC